MAFATSTFAAFNSVSALRSSPDAFNGHRREANRDVEAHVTFT